jgi:hypothetical protein
MINPNKLPFVYAVLAVVGFGLLAWAASFLFLLPASIRRTASAVRESNRVLYPDQVWFHLLHLGALALPYDVAVTGRVGLVSQLGLTAGVAAAVWDLVMVGRLAASLKREYRDRGWATAGRGFARAVGGAWAVSGLVLVLLGLLAAAAGGRGPANLAALGFVVLGPVFVLAWPVYWRIVVRHGRRLRGEGGRGYRPGGPEEDYDDAPGRPGPGVTTLELG